MTLGGEPDVNMILYVWVLSHSGLFLYFYLSKKLSKPLLPQTVKNTAAIKTHYYCFTVLIWLGIQDRLSWETDSILKWVREACSLTALTASVMGVLFGTVRSAMSAQSVMGNGMNKDQQSLCKVIRAVNLCHELQACCRQGINAAIAEFSCLIRYFDSRQRKNWHLSGKQIIDYLSNWNKAGKHDGIVVNRVKNIFLPHLPVAIFYFFFMNLYFEFYIYFI